MLPSSIWVLIQIFNLPPWWMVMDRTSRVDEWTFPMAIIRLLLLDWISHPKRVMFGINCGIRLPPEILYVWVCNLPWRLGCMAGVQFAFIAAINTSANDRTWTCMIFRSEIFEISMYTIPSRWLCFGCPQNLLSTVLFNLALMMLNVSVSEHCPAKRSNMIFIPSLKRGNMKV